MVFEKYDSRGNASLSRRLGAHLTAVGYTLFQIIAVFVLEVFVISPAVFKDPKSYYLNIALLLYFTISIIGNYYYLVVTDVSCNKFVCPDEQRTGFYYCHSCEHNSPPRAHHCTFCETCVVRRDHHCFFIANCVGSDNVRFFVLFCFFVSVASCYSTVLNMVYLHGHMGALVPLNVEGILNLIVPVTFYKWWVGSVSLLNFIIVTINWFCFAQVLVASGFGLFEMMLICSGQTTYEWRLNITHYSLGLMQNFQEICGRYWYLWWLFPIYHKLPLHLKRDQYSDRYYPKPAKGI